MSRNILVYNFAAVKEREEEDLHRELAHEVNMVEVNCRRNEQNNDQLWETTPNRKRRWGPNQGESETSQKAVVYVLFAFVKVYLVNLFYRLIINNVFLFKKKKGRKEISTSPWNTKTLLWQAMIKLQIIQINISSFNLRVSERVNVGMRRACATLLDQLLRNR